MKMEQLIKSGKKKRMWFDLPSDDAVRMEFAKAESAVKPHGLIKTLKAENEFFKGQATYIQTTPTTWRCESTDVCLEFLISQPFDKVKNELIRRGFKWEWV